MEIRLSRAAKHFGNTYVFKNFTYAFQHKNCYAIVGANGSGKTSLLLCLCGFYSLSSGKLEWRANENPIHPSDYYTLFSICSPHVSLPEELTLKEILQLQRRSNTGLSKESFIDFVVEEAYLSDFVHRYVYQLSSGTQQRVKLAITLFSEKPVLFLDEFSSHLDERGKEWAFKKIEEKKKERLVVISSNDKQERALSKHTIDIERMRGGLSPQTDI